LSVPEELGVLYDDEAWAELGVGYFPADAIVGATPTLLLLDWDSGAGVPRTLSSPRLTGALTSYPEGG
jgi:hypothetical protein